MKDKHTASLLALFLGNFGVHRFYLGQPRWGMAYLALSCTGIPALLGCLEGIRLIGLEPQLFDEQYNTGHDPAQAGPKSISQAQNITIHLPGEDKEASVTSEIARLHELFKEGALTEEEYQVQKKRILGKI